MHLHRTVSSFLGDSLASQESLSFLTRPGAGDGIAAAGLAALKSGAAIGALGKRPPVSMRSFLLGGRGQGEELTEDSDSIEEAVLCLTSWFCFCWTRRWAGDSGLTESNEGRETSLSIEGRAPGPSLSGRRPSEDPTSISRDGRVESPTSTSIE